MTDYEQAIYEEALRLEFSESEMYEDLSFEEDYEDYGVRDEDFR